MPPAYSDPCNGHFTHRLVAGFCPIEKVWSNRTVTGTARSATVGDVLPDSLQGTITSTDMAFLNIMDHSLDEAFDFTGATVVLEQKIPIVAPSLWASFSVKATISLHDL